MTEGPTPRQLDALAAWWQCGGSNVAAARVMGVTPQVMRNTLMAFRRQERAPTNIALIQRYLEQVEIRHITPHQRQASVVKGGNVTPVPSVGATSHNISFREALTAGERIVTLVPRTGVRVVDLQRERLRKQMIQAGVWRHEPLHPRDAVPRLLEAFSVLNAPIQIKRIAVAKVQPRPHGGRL